MELRQKAAEYGRWGTMFIVWTTHASLSAVPVISLSFTSNTRNSQVRRQCCGSLYDFACFFLRVEDQISYRTTMKIIILLY
jgi:hypothetical protein